MEFLPKGRCPKEKRFFGRPFPNQFTHPRVFVRFGKTKGEICVEKGDFRGDLGGVLRGLDLVWESATPPTHIWERYPKKTEFFLDTFPKVEWFRFDFS